MGYPKKNAQYKDLAKAVLGRLRLVLDELEIKNLHLEEPLGIGQSSISQWFLRGNLPIDLYFVRLPGAIFALTGRKVNLHWIATGEGEPYYRDQERESQTAGYVRGGLSVVAKIEESLTEERRRLLKADETVSARAANEATAAHRYAGEREASASPRPGRAASGRRR